MARVRVTDDLLCVELQGLHRLWAFKRRIRVLTPSSSNSPRRTMTASSSTSKTREPP